MSNILDYKKGIEYYADNCISKQFLNSTHLHASIVLSTMFKKAEHSLKIYTGRFDPKVCEADVENDGQVEYLTSLRKFLEQGFKKVQVLLDDDFEKLENSRVISLLNDKKINKDNSIELKVITSEARAKLKNKVHFTIVDNHMFRFETDTDGHKAICSFNDEETVNNLIKSFNTLFTMSKNV